MRDERKSCDDTVTENERGESRIELEAEPILSRDELPFLDSRAMAKSQKLRSESNYGHVRTEDRPRSQAGPGHNMENATIVPTSLGQRKYSNIFLCWQ